MPSHPSMLWPHTTPSHYLMGTRCPHAAPRRGRCGALAWTSLLCPPRLPSDTASPASPTSRFLNWASPPGRGHQNLLGSLAFATALPVLGGSHWHHWGAGAKASVLPLASATGLQASTPGSSSRPEPAARPHSKLAPSRSPHSCRSSGDPVGPRGWGRLSWQEGGGGGMTPELRSSSLRWSS